MGLKGLPKQAPAAERALVLATCLTALGLVACGGHSARTQKMRTALDHAQPRAALDALNDELGVRGDQDLPKSLENDDALLVLDRASVQQSVAQFDLSKRDFEAADKAIDVLDMSHGTSDDIAKWTFSDSAGRYVAPPHEKLLVNALNMVNYLETRDLSGARVEARRLAVMSRYLRDQGKGENAALGLGATLAGFTFEKSGDADEARTYYQEAARTRGAAHPAKTSWAASDDAGEILLVVGYGRVPHRVAQRVPIGLALTRASPFLAGGDHQKATELAAQGAVTWVNYPTLAPASDLSAEAPVAWIDGRAVPLGEPLDLAGLVRAEWSKIEGEVMAAAVSRAIVRFAAGKAIEAGASASDNAKVKAIGWLLSIFTQAAMTAADTPDTRSWETLPARVSLARVKVDPGEHAVAIEGRAWRRAQPVRVDAGGWAAVSLMALR
jgi:hypothetical protein